MGSRTKAGCALAVVLLCGLGRPAIADGALGFYDPLGRLINGALIVVGIIIGVAVIQILRTRWRARAARNRNRRLDQLAARPPLPPVRVVQDRGRDRSQQS